MLSAWISATVFMLVYVAFLLSVENLWYGGKGNFVYCFPLISTLSRLVVNFFVTNTVICVTVLLFSNEQVNGAPNSMSPYFSVWGSLLLSVLTILGLLYMCTSINKYNFILVSTLSSLVIGVLYLFVGLDNILLSRGLALVLVGITLYFSTSHTGVSLFSIGFIFPFLVLSHTGNDLFSSSSFSGNVVRCIDTEGGKSSPVGFEGNNSSSRLIQASLDINELKNGWVFGLPLTIDYNSPSAPGGDTPSEYSWSNKSDDSVVDYSVWVQELLWYNSESPTNSSKCIEDLSSCIEEISSVNEKEEVCIVDKDIHQCYPPHCDITFLGMSFFFSLFKLCELVVRVEESSDPAPTVFGYGSTEIYTDILD